jgi:hypothetical protein
MLGFANQQQEPRLAPPAKGGPLAVGACSSNQGDDMPIPGEMLKRGWGVFRQRPWHLAGVFTSSVEAESLAQSLGPDYVIKYGDHAPGSSDFSFTNPPGSPGV